MRHSRISHFLLLLFIPVVLFFLLRWSVVSSRSRQLSEAVNNHNLELATKLKQLGVQEDFNSDLRFQIMRRDVSAVERLIAQGADVNFQDEDWSSPLLFAVGSGSAPIIKLLVAHGADVNLKDKLEYHGTTALITAAGYHQIESTKALVDCGADVNAKTDAGNTALDAARHSQPDDYNRQVLTIQILKRAGGIARTSWPLPFEKQHKKRK